MKICNFPVERQSVSIGVLLAFSPSGSLFEVGVVFIPDPIEQSQHFIFSVVRIRPIKRAKCARLVNQG
jgi:hypothetical protein